MLNEDERKALEDMAKTLAASLEEDDKVDKLKANERSKYIAAAFDRFSTAGFIASLIASGFSLVTYVETWPQQKLAIYGFLCIIWFAMAVFLHMLGRTVLKKGLR